MTSTVTNAVLKAALDVLQRERDQLANDLSVQHARAEALHAALKQAVGYLLKTGGFMCAEDQAQLRLWRALLEESRR